MGINNLLYSDTEYSVLGPLDGYIYTVGSGTESSDGNLIIGTKSKDAGLFFIAGGTESDNIVSAFAKDYIEFARDVYVDGPIIFGDDSSQSVAAAPANYTQSAFNAANTAAANTVISQAVNLTQNTNIASAQSFANGAFTTSNSAFFMSV